MPALCIERVVRGGFNSTFATKIILKEAWQVQRDDSRQHGAGMGKPVADKEKKEFKIDLRVHGIPQTAVDQGEDRTRGIKRSAHMIIFRSKEKALIRDLQKTDTFNPFCEESKRVIHNLGNVDCFDLCEISSKTHCSSCSTSWADGVVYCTCLIPAENMR